MFEWLEWSMLNELQPQEFQAIRVVRKPRELEIVKRMGRDFFIQITCMKGQSVFKHLCLIQTFLE